MKKSFIAFMVLLAMTSFGCNNENDTNGDIVPHEIGDSCEDNYFSYSCNSDRTSVVECSEKTDGIVKEFNKCGTGTHCAAILHDKGNYSFGCYGDQDKCENKGEITECGIPLIQPEAAAIKSCLPSDDGNYYIFDVNDRRYCSGLCSESCVEKPCKNGDVSYCSDDKLIAYNCIANDFAELHDKSSEYVISAEQCTQIAPCKITSEGKAECIGE